MTNYIEEKVEFLAGEFNASDHGEEVIRTTLTEVDRRARADWLRSEIEKLEGVQNETRNFPMKKDGTNWDEWNDGYDRALTSIITRYKEELKALTGE